MSDVEILRLIYAHRQQSDRRLHATVTTANQGDHGAEEIVQLAAVIEHERAGFHALGRLWADLRERWPELADAVAEEAAARAHAPDDGVTHDGIETEGSGTG